MRKQTFYLLAGLAAAAGLWYFTRNTQTGAAAVVSVSDALGGLLTPRGIRNRNPGNIERTSIQWQGSMNPQQVADAGLSYDQTFEQFDTPANGIRAIGHIMLSKAARGLVTVSQIISDYSATDQAAYIANVSAALGVGPDDPIDVQSQLPALATAIIQQENGLQPYADSDIQAWVYS